MVSLLSLRQYSLSSHGGGSTLYPLMVSLLSLRQYSLSSHTWWWRVAAAAAAAAVAVVAADISVLSSV